MPAPIEVYGGKTKVPRREATNTNATSTFNGPVILWNSRDGVKIAIVVRPEPNILTMD
jgi:hypothetical protein